MTVAPVSRALPAPSYRRLLAIDGFRPLIASALLSRTALTMSTVVFVLFALGRYRSPSIAGLTVFLLIFPGLLLSPVNGALLDRFGRVRMMVLDFGVAAGGVLLVALLARAGVLGVAWLLLIVGATSLTSTLSAAGARSLFPLVVPRDLWERANAADVLCYGASAVTGPALAGVLVGLAGAADALPAIAVLYAAAAVLLLRIREPRVDRPRAAGVLRDALAGVRYVVSRPSLRWLAVTMCLLNIGWGIVTVALPLEVLSLHGSAGLVGALFAVQGLVGVPAALVGGRLDTRGRERPLMAFCFATVGCATLLLLIPTLAALFPALALVGAADGPLNVALFSLRQRRTDPAWFGRAFAISISLNYSGTPVGAALAGPLAGHGTAIAILVAAVLPLVAAALVWRIPRSPVAVELARIP
jgi:MFS family permease